MAEGKQPDWLWSFGQPRLLVLFPSSQTTQLDGLVSCWQANQQLTTTVCGKNPEPAHSGRRHCRQFIAQPAEGGVPNAPPLRRVLMPAINVGAVG